MATIITRTTGPTSKGTELSYTELDNNFINLNTDKYESGDSPSFGSVGANVITSNSIDVDNLTVAQSFTLSNTELTILSDATSTQTIKFLASDSGNAEITFDHTTNIFRFEIESNEEFRVDTTGATVAKTLFTTNTVADLVTANNLSVINANADQLTANNLFVTDIITDGITTNNLSATNANADQLTANNLFVTNVTADEITVNNVFGNEITANNFNSTSDYRLKDNVIEYNYNVTDMIKTLRVVSFNFKTNPEKTEVGFIAHELQESFPGLVNGEKDGEETQTISMMKLIPFLVKSLQETNERVRTLEKQLELFNG